MRLFIELQKSTHFPKASDEAQWDILTQELRDIAKDSEDASLTTFVEKLLEDDIGSALLASVFGNSPYLSKIITKDIAFVREIASEGSDAAYEHILKDLATLPFDSPKDELMAALRKNKLRCALVTALADISGIWSLEKITHHLSEFADKALSIAVNHALFKASLAGNIILKDKADPSKESGLVVLGVGKLGSFELNYSSDIDIIFFYDEERVDYHGKVSISHFFIRLAQEVTHILQERTGDGYVFRTDLRLRPDPGSTPAAMSVSAARVYYETVGQNWERAAMIKARVCAGDRDAGTVFLDFLKGYIWRKHLDFESIQDIHSIKRQIDSRQGKLPEGMFGYHIKLGHGGIREIEFYAQTQQLIWGGREPRLKEPATCKALIQLHALGHITVKARDELISAYEFYRTVEHRLQMVADEQTHSLPANAEGMEAFAIFLGFESTEKFIHTLTTHINKVQGHYRKLFDSAPSLAGDDLGIPGSLVFTGIENDPETLETLTKMGYSTPDLISEIVRGWHHGRRPITTTKRAREILTELMPLLLLAFSRTAYPDTALARFDEFLGRLPKENPIFSLFYAQPQVLELLADILGDYPYLAENLSRKPILLDYVLSQEFYSALPDVDVLKDELKTALKEARNYDETLDICRAWAHDRQFRIAIQMVKEQISPELANTQLSNIAEASLTVCLRTVFKDFAKQHGKVSADSLAIIAMGKLGSRELTFESDLDIVFVYDPTGFPEDSALSANEYYARLSRKFISAITSLSQQGSLYEVDTRLRPSGKDGPVASSIESYGSYYRKNLEDDATQNTAWDWEYMALTRARVIAGGSSLKKEIEKIIRDRIQMKWDRSKLGKRIADIREQMYEEFGNTNPFNIKHVRGGLVDIEFINQYLKLVNARENPEILESNTRLSFGRMYESGIVTGADFEVLDKAISLYHSTQTILRLMDNKNPEEATLTPGMKDTIAKAIPSKNYEELKKTLEDSQKKVQNLFDRIILTA